MKFSLPLLCLFLLPALLNADPSIKVELIAPDGPITLAKENLAIAEKAARAAEGIKMILESPKLDDELRKEMAEFQKTLEKARQSKLGITLKLRLTNTGDKRLVVHYGADTSTNYLKVKGPEAVDLPFDGPMTADFRMPEPTTIEAGKSKDFDLKELHYGARDMSRWLIGKPGDYEVFLRFVTRIGGEKVDLKTNRVTLKIESAE